MSVSNQAISTHISVSITETLAGLNQLEEGWLALETKTRGQLGIFQSFNWCKNWLEQWVNNGEYVPIIITAFQDGELVCVWPMQKSTTSNVAVLSWLGTPLIQYGSPLVDVACDVKSVTSSVWRTICGLKNIDIVRLHNVPEISPVHPFLKTKCRSAGSTCSSILDIGEFADWDEYCASMKTSTRRPRRKRFNKLSRAGVMKFEVHKSGRHFADLAKVAIGWKQQWLKQHNWPTTTMADPRLTGFVTSLGARVDRCEKNSPRNQTNHWVIGELSIDSKPIALEIGVVEAGHYYSFLGAYDLDWASYSPGKVQIESMISWALEYGIQSYDFLCVAAQYKSDWTNKTVIVDHFAYPLSVRGRLYHSIWLKRLRPAAKYGLQKLNDNQRDKLMSLFGLSNKGAGTGNKHA